MVSIFVLCYEWFHDHGYKAHMGLIGWSKLDPRFCNTSWLFVSAASGVLGRTKAILWFRPSLLRERILRLKSTGSFVLQRTEILCLEKWYPASLDANLHTGSNESGFMEHGEVVRRWDGEKWTLVSASSERTNYKGAVDGPGHHITTFLASSFTAAAIALLFLPLRPLVSTEVAQCELSRKIRYVHDGLIWNFHVFDKLIIMTNGNLQFRNLVIKDELKILRAEENIGYAFIYSKRV